MEENKDKKKEGSKEAPKEEPKKEEGYFNIELKSTLIHAILGLVAGYVSGILAVPIQGLIVALAILVVTVFAVKTIFKIEEDKRWFLGNGVLAFIFIWYVTFTIFFNIGV